MSVRPTVLRVLLPMLLALGVAGLHTLGHPGTGHSGMGGPVAMAAAYKQAVVPSLHCMPVMVSTPVLGVVATGMRTGLDPSKACLAVLTAMGLLALIGALLYAGRIAGGGGWRCAMTGMLERGPPGPPIGLRLANLSVVRR